MQKALLHHVPIALGMFVLLLTLPVILLNLQYTQNLKKQAAARTFTLPANANYVPGQIVIKYRDNVELKTDVGVNQHTQAFDIDQVSSDFSGPSMNNLESVGTRKMERVFKSARLPQEKSGVQSLLNVFGAGPKPDPLANYVVATVSSTSSIETSINLLLKDPNVESATPNYRTTVFQSPNDTYYASQQWSLPKVSAPAAWDVTTGSASITVGEVDTGIDWNHPDLSPNLTGGFDATGATSNGQDACGHGTHVAGIIDAVGNNGVGIAGMNWSAKLLPIRAFDANCSGTDTWMAAAIDYAASHGAKVINISAGQDQDTAVLKAAVDNAVDTKGVTIVAAAGNGTNNNRVGTTLDNTWPAAYPNVIAVENTDNTDHLSSSSNYGSKATVAAPGTGIFSTYPLLASTTHYASACFSYPKGYCILSGTSMAAPAVTGVVALMLAKNPSLSPATIKSLLKSSADDTGTLDPQRNRVLRLNAKQAVDAAIATTPTPSPSGSSSSSSSASPTPTGTPAGSGVAQLAGAISAACGPFGIVAKNTGSATNRNWISYVDTYGGQNFAVSGDLYIYAAHACTVNVGGGGATATPTPSGTATSTPTPTPGGTSTPTTTATGTPTPSPSPTPCPSAFWGTPLCPGTTATPTPSPKPTATPCTGTECPLNPGGSATPTPTPTPNCTLIGCGHCTVGVGQCTPTPPGPATQTTVGGQTVNLVAGWNKVTVTGTGSSTSTNTSVQSNKKPAILKLLGI